MEVEVALSPSCFVSPVDLRSRLQQVAESSPQFFMSRPLNLQSLPGLSSADSACITKVSVYGNSHPITVHCFVLHDDDCHENVVDNDGEVLAVASQTVLPSVRFQHDWDSLIYDDSQPNVKETLLSFMSTSVTFGDHGVSSDVVGCNRILLLHGPPGTGKTTICHGLAQKLSIRYSHRFDSGVILDVNTHSIFSKWFAESGKMVKKLFDRLNQIADDPRQLVFVLIDEVESLATARHSAMNGSDPSDAIRVVNALLTQIDAIRRKTNVVIMATSNLSECIDVAFLSRADLRQFVGPPSESARYVIFKSCIDELIDKGMIVPQYDLLDLDSCAGMDRTVLASFASTGRLLQAAAASEGLTGRILRKLPFLAFVYRRLKIPVQLDDFLGALQYAIEQKNGSAEPG
jgi:hypothetical protein